MGLIRMMRIIYEAKQKAIRDRQAEDDWIRKEAREEGEIAGEIKGRAEGEIEGKIESAISVYQEMNQSRPWIVSKIAERFGLSEEKAERKIEENDKEQRAVDWLSLFNEEIEEELAMIAEGGIKIRAQLAIKEIKRLHTAKRMQKLYEASLKEMQKRQVEDDKIRKEARAEGMLSGEIKGRTAGKIEGKIKGAISTYQEMNQSRSWTVSKIAERFYLTKEKAERKVEEYWKE